MSVVDDRQRDHGAFVVDIARVRGHTHRLAVPRDTVERLGQIDQLIAETAERWRPERMAVLDRLILRMAICELLRDKEVPHAVVINEAVELARTFSTEDAVKYFEAAKVTAENQKNNDPNAQAITVVLEIKNGKITFASVPERRPGLETYEATALRFARKLRFPSEKNGAESVVVRVSPTPGS